LKTIESAPKPARTPPPQKPKKQVPPPKTYSTWHDLIKQYSLDWIILLAAVAIAVLLVAYEGDYRWDLIHARFFAVKKKPAPAPVSAELHIENVVFSTVEHKGQVRFVVKGEVVNSSPMTVVSPDLKVVAWGECPPSTTEPRHHRCILTQWIHPMAGQLISAGKRQLFQAFAPTQGVIEAKEVEITGK
jgi:hypothetical protein